MRNTCALARAAQPALRWLKLLAAALPSRGCRLCVCAAVAVRDRLHERLRHDRDVRANNIQVQNERVRHVINRRQGPLHSCFGLVRGGTPQLFKREIVSVPCSRSLPCWARWLP